MDEGWLSFKIMLLGERALLTLAETECMNKLKYLIASLSTSFRDFLDNIRLVSVCRFEFLKIIANYSEKKRKKQGDR